MPSSEENTWTGAAGAGGIDLRSDTMTTPTPSMLSAINSCTLLDDVFQEDPTTNNLEAHCAELTGKEAGLFVLSGTMGNQLALRALLTQPPHGVICDHRSHIIRYEAGGVSSLTGAMITAVVPKNGIHLTLEDLKAHAKLDDDIHTCPTRVVSLENTLNGMITPLAEVRRISKWARENGLKMHLDGARLWEVAASGEGSLVDFAECFDTLTLCFSKGLGAPVGSMLLGSKAVIKHARWTRKAIGGGTRQSGIMTSAAAVALQETFGRGPSGEGGLLKQSHELAKRLEALWTALGGKLIHPVQTNMIWLDLDAANCSATHFDNLGTQEGLKISGPRLITHYQIYQNAEVIVPKLERIFRKVLEQGDVDGGKNGTANQGVKPMYVSGQ